MSRSKRYQRILSKEQLEDISAFQIRIAEQYSLEQEEIKRTQTRIYQEVEEDIFFQIIRLLFSVSNEDDEKELKEIVENDGIENFIQSYSNIVTMEWGTPEFSPNPEHYPELMEKLQSVMT